MVIPLIFFNPSASAVDITIESELPAGWTAKEPTRPIHVAAHTSIDIQAIVSAPPSDEVAWQELHWFVRANGSQAGNLTLRVLTGRGGLPQ